MKHGTNIYPVDVTPLVHLVSLTLRMLMLDAQRNAVMGLAYVACVDRLQRVLVEFNTPEMPKAEILDFRMKAEGK